MEDKWLIKWVVASKGPFVAVIQYKFVCMQYEAESVIEVTVVECMYQNVDRDHLPRYCMIRISIYMLLRVGFQ